MYDPVKNELKEALEHLKAAIDLMYDGGDRDIRIGKTLYTASIIEKLLKIKNP